MEFLSELWLPILLSAVFVFIASSVIHMVIPIHKGDYVRLPNEEATLAAMREHRVPPGDYMFPHCGSMKEMGSPETIEKFKRGPVGTMTIIPSGPYNMGRSLLQWFVFTLVISLFCAYVAHIALGGQPADYLEVFQVTGTVAVLAYGVSNVTNSIWKGVKWSTTWKFVFDGIVYGLVTAGTFGWLWPSLL